MDILPKTKTVVGKLSAEEQAKLDADRQKALETMGSLAAFTAAVPVGTILPFQNLLNDKTKRNIEIKEAQALFPQADPSLFEKALSFESVIPQTQRIAAGRIFGNVNTGQYITEPRQEYLTFLKQPAGPVNPELGTFQQAISNQPTTDFPTIQAITVTPGPNPSRFAKDYAEIIADKLGTAKTQYLQNEMAEAYGDIPSNVAAKNAAKLQSKITTLSNKVPGTAGYVWGNIDEPQYSYASGNWGLGENFQKENPSIYISRINADPSKEADYLYTGDILQDVGDVEPRTRLKQFKDEGLSTGPSWGISDRTNDISFRKDLIQTRGELTMGDIQALLAQRNLPYKFKATPDAKSGDLLQTNLMQLAASENLTPYQAVEKYARVVPNVGNPLTSATEAAFGTKSKFQLDTQILNPESSFGKGIDLRQVGVFPPKGKETYTAFIIDDFDKPYNDYTYPRHNASTLKEIIPPKTVPALPGSLFEEDFIPGVYEFNINRDALRPKAAQRLLNQKVQSLVNSSQPIKGLGVGGLAAGGIATIADPAVIDALSQGDYQTALKTGALNTAIGTAVGGGTNLGLRAMQAAGYARPAAMVGSALPVAGGVLGGIGLAETGKALNRAYKARTGKDWVTRNQVPTSYPTYAGPTPQIQPRMGTAILGGKQIQVPYGSVAGTRTVGRPWWDKAGSQFQGLLNRFNPNILGR